MTGVEEITKEKAFNLSCHWSAPKGLQSSVRKGCTMVLISAVEIFCSFFSFSIVKGLYVVYFHKASPHLHLLRSQCVLSSAWIAHALSLHMGLGLSLLSCAVSY